MKHILLFVVGCLSLPIVLWAAPSDDPLDPLLRTADEPTSSPDPIYFGPLDFFEHLGPIGTSPKVKDRMFPGSVKLKALGEDWDDRIDKDFASAPLKDFNFPNRVQVLKMLGISDKEGLLKRLKVHIAGNKDDRKRISELCEKKFSNWLKPTEENLGCLFWQLDRIAPSAASLTKKKSGGGKRKNYRSSRIKKEEELKIFSDYSYSNMLEHFDIEEWSHAQRIFQWVDEGKSCPSKAFCAALFRKMEEFLPKSLETMDKLYQSLDMSPQDSFFEIIHLRWALIQLGERNTQRAMEALDKASQASDTEEGHRVLYWRGYLDYKDSKSKENKHWTELSKRYPLGLHTLLAQSSLGQDPFELVSNRPSPKVRVFEGNQWHSANLMALLICLLEDDPRILKEAVRRMGDRIFAKEFASSLFFTKVYQKVGYPMVGIKHLYQDLKDIEMLNKDVLSLLYPIRYRSFVMEYAGNLDPAFTLAVIRQESSFNPKANSSADARGLMQVTPDTAKNLFRKKTPDLWDPKSNIHVGTVYLSKLLKKHNNQYVWATASYNAGPRKIDLWLERYPYKPQLLQADLIPYTETRNYVSILLRNMYWYSTLLDSKDFGKSDLNILREQLLKE